nr:immunoglobulin light chain junction region [Macaca mulatta]
CLQGYDNPLTC